MKYCCSCGAALPDSAAFCSACGKAVDPPLTRPAETPAAVEAAVEAPAAAPVAQPEPIVYEQPVVQPMYPTPAPKSANLFAILAMAAGGTALTAAMIALAVTNVLLLSLFAVGNGVVAIIFAGKARGARLRGLAKAGKILAIIGLVFGGLSLLADISLFLGGDVLDHYGDIFDT